MRGGRSKAYVCNLTNANEIEGLRFRVAAEAGVPDVLINNAGGGRWAYLEDCSYAEIDEMIAAPLHAALYVTRAFLPGMLRRGTGMIGNVTFIVLSSVAWRDRLYCRSLGHARASRSDESGLERNEPDDNSGGGLSRRDGILEKTPNETPHNAILDSCS